MSRQVRIAVLWFVLVVGMILHFTYSLTGLRYGVSIESPNATGVVPWSNVGLKATFYVVPALLGTLTLYLKHRVFRILSTIAAALFLLANGAHFAAEGVTPESSVQASQSILLGTMVVWSLLLVVDCVRWWRKDP
ncbi:MAG: hypothetical protein AAGE52_00510 [Myxococcota bacterium]